MRASVLSDALQATLMVCGLLVAVAVGLEQVGGVDALYGRAVAVDPTLFGWGMSPVRIAGFAAAFGLGMVVAPYEVSRVYAMRNPETVETAIKGSIAIQAVVAVCVALLGLIARITHPSLASPDAAVAVLVQSLLGPLVGGTLLIAILAAILSTVDSVLLVSASALAHDLYAVVLRPEDGIDLDPLDASPEDDVLVVARVATVLAAVLPFGLAVHRDLIGGLVQVIVALYAALVAGTLFAPVVLGLHWEGTSTWGGLAGVVVGFGTVVGWHVATDIAGVVAEPAAAVPPVIAGVLASAAAVVVVSTLSRARGRPAP